nr:nitroreductase [Desulfurococcales archaeon]
LQATALGLGTVAVGAFYDDEVKRVVGVAEGEPLYIMPVGRPVSIYDLREEELRRYYEKNR